MIRPFGCLFRETDAAMKFTTTLKKNHEFRRLYARGESAVTPVLVVYVLRKRTWRENRVGFTVGTKVGKAVTRNRVRRRLKEIYRLHESELAHGVQMVIVARARAAGTDYAHLERDFLKACGKLGVLVEETP